MEADMLQTKIVVEIVGVSIAALALIISVVSIVFGRGAKKTATDANKTALNADNRAAVICDSNDRIQRVYEEKIEALEAELTLERDALETVGETLAQANLELESQRMTDSEFLSNMQTINVVLAESGHKLVAPNKNFGAPIAIAIRAIREAQYNQRRAEMLEEGAKDGERNCVDEINKTLTHRNFALSVKRTTASMIERLSSILDRVVVVDKETVAKAMFDCQLFTQANECERGNVQTSILSGLLELQRMLTAAAEKAKQNQREATEYRSCISSVRTNIQQIKDTGIRELADEVVQGTVAEVIHNVIERFEHAIWNQEQKYVGLAEQTKEILAEATNSFERKLDEDDPVPF